MATEQQPKFNRRRFIQSLSVPLLSGFSLSEFTSAAIQRSTLYASAYKDLQGGFGVAVIDTQKGIIAKQALPGRAHAVVASPKHSHLVTFARRPGRFALAFCLSERKNRAFFYSAPETHFYGHGAFSMDGKYLFATEQNFDEGEGLVGVYDATHQFKRIDQFRTHGIGPHEMILMPDGKTLCVANGGILTHPETGRTKLNLPTMQSSVVFLDAQSGALKQQYVLPPNLRRLSLRHLDIAADQTVWLGGQYEGAAHENVPLIASASLERGLHLHHMPPKILASLSHYIGSVACNRQTGHIAFSSPKGNTYLVINSEGEVLTHQKIEQVCGLAVHNNGFIHSSLQGRLHKTHHKIYWDNHLQKLPLALGNPCEPKQLSSH